MFARWPHLSFVFALAAAFSACSGGGVPPLAAPAGGAAPPTDNPGLQVGNYTAAFTEYNLPLGQHGPMGLTVGPDGAIWFTVNDGIDRVLGSGTITPFAAPLPIVYEGIASLDGSLWYAVKSADQTSFLVRQGTTGAPAIVGGIPHEPQDVNLAVGRDGHLWAALHSGNVGGNVVAFDGSGALRADVSIPYDAKYIAAGPDGNIYVTAFQSEFIPDSVVFQISTAGKILNRFDLPHNSFPAHITAGTDGALWIAAPGNRQILRLTTSGAVTQFQLSPAFFAPPYAITKGSDGAVWFTEGNGIGRITTSGVVTNYPLSPDAGVHDIVSCPQACISVHGRLWFTEYIADKVGKLEF